MTILPSFVYLPVAMNAEQCSPARLAFAAFTRSSNIGT